MRALFIGAEASSLLRFSLTRRGYVDAGSVAATDRNEAEQPFFARYAQGAADAARASGASTTAIPGRGSDEVVGLFPEFRGR